jgi:hypothetical protein
MGRGSGTITAVARQASTRRTTTTADAVALVAKAKQSRSEPSLIPMGRQYMENDFNVLLIGVHGTGKTESVMQLARELGLRLKIYSCATLDPYTDLVGVPVPDKDDQGRDLLRMVRPRDIDEADVVFFDELNRAAPAVQNAVFEIIQFRSINGERLPNLRASWAAMNPDTEEYEVEKLDPALVDRFDAYVELQPKPSISYMSQYIPAEMAKGLHMWWSDHQRAKRGPESYISPRRLLKIGIVFDKLGSSKAIAQALPPGGTYDTKKLIQLLSNARDGKPLVEKTVAPIAQPASNKFIYTPAGIARQQREIVKHVRKNPHELETPKRVLDALAKNVGVDGLLTTYAQVLEAMPAAQLEGWFRGFAPAKQSQLRSAYVRLYERRNKQPLPNLRKVLAKSGTMLRP